jgi:imidazolonepropionase-like amidohydrolase
MPEAPGWRFQKLIAPLFDLPTPHRILKGTVLTSVGDERIENGFVEMEGDKLKAVGRAADLGSTDAEVIETGGTILPGLFQNHAHLAWDGIHDLAWQSMYDTPEMAAYKSAGNMLIAVRAGITSFRDLGVNKANFAAKQAVEQGYFPGPRLYITGEAIVQTAGHTFWACREASGADEMRRAVRDQVRGGADLIKIMGCHDRLEFTDAELEAVIDEAHRNGLYVTAHATYDACISRSLKFGVDCIEHAGNMTDETIQLFLDKKVPIVTTFAPLVMQAQPEVARKFNIPEWKIAERQKAVADPNRYAAIAKAARAGVPIAFGTDAGSPAVAHNVIVPEMKFMIRQGVVTDNYAAIRSATAVSSRVNRVEKKLGTLEAGKLADVIVVKGDPLADLEALTAVQMVFIGGKRLV